LATFVLEKSAVVGFGEATKRKVGKDSMFHMIGHAIFGLIIGLLARAVMPGRQHMGLIMTMILGLVGAWLGGLLGRMTGMYEEGHPAGFLMAFV